MSSIIQSLEQQVTSIDPFYVSIFSFVFFTYFLIKWLICPASTHKNLPPSPPKLPILGNLHQVGGYLHRSLLSLARRYGPDLMLLHFGIKPALVVSSSDAAREIMKTHDLAFSNRPKFGSIGKLLYNHKDVAGGLYGDHWKQMKSVLVHHVLSNRRVQTYRSVREEEVACLIEKIQDLCSSSSPVNLSKMFSSFTYDVICRISFGRKYDSGDRGESGKIFQKLLGDLMILLGSFDLREFIPWLGWVISWVNGFDAYVDRTAKGLDKFIDGIVEEHINSLERKAHSDVSKEYVKDFVQVLVELQKDTNMGANLDRESIKALILDIFAGGSDTTYTVLEWTMTEIIRHPRVMKELQNEVKRISDENSVITRITEADLNKMHYLKLVIKESLRLHTPFPLLAARETIQDVKIMGYDIAAGTMVLTNAWAMARDPKTWTKPEEFWPERFLNSCVDFKGHDHEFIPFGSGRRGCPGISFSMSIIELVLANLVKNFEWVLPEGTNVEDLDMTESIGMTTSRKNPLIAVAIPISK
ncbi:cytochrome P450 736A117 [Ricinus communis]|uniref:Cytochrome P450, putative n=1 Tax=Ricinus communis TaxID=3988 RepID=B9RAS4_RICCO|nr:cytochrome P450 736A117 [Ricinus communis]EEF51901.1 cytochrome P450, putative [Ricinus communis]|eukprot:XP_002511299.1 psoralen synthase [Ricinus communis]